MGEYYYELYTLNDGRLNLDHTASNDMAYLPALEFTPLDLSAGEELNAYRDFLSNGQHLNDVRYLMTSATAYVIWMGMESVNWL